MKGWLKSHELLRILCKWTGNYSPAAKTHLWNQVTSHKTLYLHESQLFSNKWTLPFMLLMHKKFKCCWIPLLVMGLSCYSSCCKAVVSGFFSLVRFRWCVWDWQVGWCFISRNVDAEKIESSDPGQNQFPLQGGCAHIWDDIRRAYIEAKAVVQMRLSSITKTL